MFKKYTYILVGIAILIWAGCITFWSLEEVSYFFTSQTAQIRIIGSVVSWIFGILYLYYGIRHIKINCMSNISLIIILLVSIISVLLLNLGSCPIGGTCPSNVLLASSLSIEIFGWGVVLSFILLVASLFIRKRA
jgi:hypothetical protein